ncbi:MAG: Uma2 family endonuclease [Micromonosporaceae bacterium]
MTAQPVEPDHAPVWLRRPPPHGWTVEDVLNLPDDAPRVELVDGVMRVVPSPTYGHQNLGNLLWTWLRGHAPPHMAPVTAVGVGIDLGNTREPDVLLLREVPPDIRRHFFKPDEVVLVVEIVSEGSRRLDRFEKPIEYARAGIPHYWRVELEPAVRVHAYDLVDGEYVQVAEAADALVLTEPFEIWLPIAEITP